MDTTAFLLGDSAWTLSESVRIVQDSKRLEQRTREIALTYWRRRLRLIAGGSTAERAFRRILIVDDDPRILQLLGDGLKQSYTIETAMSGGEALAAIQRQRPDLILLDVILPGMSGIHLLKQIKQRDRTIAVIILTGSGNALLEAQALENGAEGFVRKPFDLSYLERLVAEIVRG